MESDMKLVMAGVESSPLLGVHGILRESLRIPYRNRKLMFSIILLVLVPFSLLSLGFDLSLRNIMTDLAAKSALLPKEDPNSPEAQKILSEISEDIRKLLGIEAIFMFGFGIISLFSLVTTVYSSAVTFMGQHLTLSDLFLRIKVMLKRPMITAFYIILISIAYFFLAAVLISLTTFLTSGVTLIVLVAVMLLVASLFYLYLSTVWMLGLVISIVEEDCYGIEAVGKAGKLIKGRKLQGLVLMLLLSLLASASSVISLMSGSAIKHGSVARSLIRIIMMGVICLVKIFSFVVFTVFYFECKKIHGEQVEVAEPKGYVVLSTEV